MLVGQTKADAESGAVYVFTRDAGGSWRETGSIKAPERHPGDAFGARIAIADGRAYISTGVSGFGSMVFTRRSGSVFVFRNTASVLLAASVRLSILSPEDPSSTTRVCTEPAVSFTGMAACPPCALNVTVGEPGRMDWYGEAEPKASSGRTSTRR
jgi:hypothetical protein